MNPPSDVFISVVAVDEDLVYFAGTVRFGSTFVVHPGGESNRFENEITVSISELDSGGEPGRTLQVLELRARSQTSSAIRSLLELAPKLAHRLDAQDIESDESVSNRASIVSESAVYTDSSVLEFKRPVM